MKKKLNIKFALFIAFIVAVSTSCTKDPYDGLVSNERSIEAFNLGSDLTQVGPAEVDADAGTVVVKVLMQNGTDLSKVTPQVITSYKSTVSPNSDETVDFASNNNKVKYTVTSESGKTREWEVELVPFTETILGTYIIQKQVAYGGTGPEYGGVEVIDFNVKTWLWSDLTGPKVELDNTLVFGFEGVTEDGKTFGKVTNNAGADGKYSNYIFTGTPQTDVNHLYRKIPVGEGKWERDYTANTVTFTSSTGTVSTATFRGAETISLGYGRNKVITDNSFDFAFSGGVDDWGPGFGSDYNKLVQKPSRFWIDVKKQ